MNYRNLIKDLKSIVSEGLTDRKQDLNLATTHTNWELGKRLVGKLKLMKAISRTAGFIRQDWIMLSMVCVAFLRSQTSRFLQNFRSDTIVVYIELGLGMRTRQRLRFQSVNTASLYEQVGLQARDFVVEQIENAGYILLRTSKRDKYARFVADVLLGQSGQSVADVLESGVFLNQALLDQNMAVWAG